MARIIIIFFTIFILSGCSALENLDELLTLKEYSASQDEMDKYVKGQDAKFPELLKAVQDSTIEQYKTKKTFRIAFGAPVFERQVQEGDKEVTEALYRYSRKYFNSDKVYVYFDKKGNLLNWKLEKEPTQEKTNAQNSN